MATPTWILKPGLSEIPNSRPHKLTEDEIQGILAQIPVIHSAAKAVAQRSRQEILNQMYRVLKTIELSPLALAEFTQQIVRQFEMSRISPGAPVGIIAAESLGRIFAQSTLNTFHQSGFSKNMGSNIDMFREIINVSRKRKFTNTTIYLKNPNVTYFEALRFRRSLVGVTISFLSTDYDIDSPDDLREDYWTTYEEITGRQLPPSSYVMRLYFSVDKLYSYQVRLQRLCSLIEDDNPKTLICVPSPLHLGIIDIFPFEERALEAVQTLELSLDKDLAVRFFLEKIVLNDLLDRHVQGVPGITAIFVVFSNVWQIVSLQEPYPVTSDIPETDPRRRMWILTISLERVHISGVTIERLIDLLTSFNIEVANRFERTLFVVSPTNKRPGDIIGETLSQLENTEVQEDLERRRRLDPAPPLRDPLLSKGRLYYIETNGSNLGALLARDDIDKTRTYTNDFHEVYEYFGIEAARNLWMLEFTRLMASIGEYVDPRHINLLAAFIFNREPTGINFGGISRQPIGHLSIASFQQSVKIMSRSALFNLEEQVEGTSASIYVGKRITPGTGFVDIRLDPEVTQAVERKTEFGHQLDPEKFTEALKDLETKVSGLDISEAEEDLNLLATYGRMSTVPQIAGREMPIRPIQAPPVIVKPKEVPVKAEPIISDELIQALEELSIVPSKGPDLSDPGDTVPVITPLHISPVQGEIIEEVPSVPVLEDIVEETPSVSVEEMLPRIQQNIIERPVLFYTD